MLSFTGKTVCNDNIEFDFTEIGAMYESDDIVYITGVPVLISSIKVID